MWMLVGDSNHGNPSGVHRSFQERGWYHGARGNVECYDDDCIVDSACGSGDGQDDSCHMFV